MLAVTICLGFPWDFLWVSLFTGVFWVGASRVRALYQEAKENAPSVVFIDELDSVGRERGLIKGSGGQERDATLNQLLVCLDGFEGRGEVITIASTNRPDILDPALVRPGRFDRKIYIPKPGLIGRLEILKVHARKKPMAEDVDYMAVASMTDGMVGAELANIVEVAALNMIREGRTEVAVVFFVVSSFQLPICMLVILKGVGLYDKRNFGNACMIKGILESFRNFGNACMIKGILEINFQCLYDKRNFGKDLLADWRRRIKGEGFLFFRDKAIRKGHSPRQNTDITTFCSSDCPINSSSS